MIENIRLSFQGIRSHRMRSALTMLGIIIGIASIIVIVSLITGTSEQLKSAMVNSGDDNITVTLFDKDNSWVALDPIEVGLPEGITKISSDVMDQVKSLKGVVNASKVYRSEYALSVAYNANKQSACVLGVDEEFFSMKNYVLSSGRYFIDRDYKDRHNVAVVSSSLASALFQNEDALGKTITISNEIYTIVGVYTENVDYSNVNTLSDYYLKVGMAAKNFVIVPSTSWVNFGGFESFQTLIVKVASPDDTVNAGKECASLLNQNISSNKYEYRSTSLQDDAQSLESITKVISILLVGIASISLLVGGIGVMNIMLVSVTERTSEIGLKKAIGARKRTILFQLLTESAVLTSMGGVIGVAVGIIQSQVISRVTATPVSISVPAIILSVEFSMLIGILFGILPSIKAANLNPIDALRSE